MSSCRSLLAGKKVGLLQGKDLRACLNQPFLPNKDCALAVECTFTHAEGAEGLCCGDSVTAG